MNKFLLASALLLGLPGIGAAQVGSRVLMSGDGTAEAFITVSAASQGPVIVPFVIDQEMAVTNVQFYGRKTVEGGSIAVTLASGFQAGAFVALTDGVNQKVTRPLAAIPSTRNTWHSVTFIPAIRVNGSFVVGISVEGGGEFQLGSDQSAAANVIADGQAPELPMVRVTLRDPSYVAPPRPTPAPRPQPSIGATPPANNTAASRPGANRTPMVANTPAAGSFAYRAPNRALSYVNRAPAIPRGSGRVDVSWNVRPVTIELNYVGKPARILENLDVQRLVVDFPVPEPGLFNVVLKKPGYKSEARQFRVVAGGRQEWRVMLEPGADDAAPAPAMDNLPPADNGMEPLGPVIEDEAIQPLPDAGGNQPPPQGPPPGFGNNPPAGGPGPGAGGPGAGNRPPRGNRPPGDNAAPGAGNPPGNRGNRPPGANSGPENGNGQPGEGRGNRPPRGNRNSGSDNPREGVPPPSPAAPVE